MSENNQKNKNILRIYMPIILSIILVLGVLIGINLNLKRGSGPESKFFSISFDNEYHKIKNVINFINEYYVDTVDHQTLEEETIRSLLNNLDPHSSYISSEDFRELNDPLMGSFEGIGIEFNMINDTVMVINPISGGPSEKIGIMSGDRIIKVNNKNIAGVKKSTDDIVRMLKGEKGTEVKVTVHRRGVDDPLEFTIVRDKIPTHSLDIAYKYNDDIGYIRLNRFSATTHNEFRNALDGLKAQNMSKLILDLRGNGGGVMDAAINIADELLKPRNLIVYTDGRRRDRNYAYANRQGAFEDGEIIILIDEWSASASEIVAGAIQDNDRGLVVGRRSFGKGLVQEQVQLGDGSAIRLTTARYYTPTGRSIQTPYKDGTSEDYFSDFINRLMDDPLEKEIHDSLIFQTKGGRKVYGGGGITPDVLIPAKRNESNVAFNKLVNKGLIYEFAFDYADRNRTNINKYENAQRFVKEFEIKYLIFNDFLQFVNSRDLELDEEDIKESKERIMNHLKAYIGRNIFGNDAFYPVIHKKDETFNEAVNLFTSNRYKTYLAP